MGKNLAPVQLDADVQAGLDGLSPGDSGGAGADASADENAESRPRARVRSRVEPVDDAPTWASTLGGRPPNATHWGVKKRNAMGEWESKTWSPEGSAIALAIWPLSELTEEVFCDRWGDQGGTFEIQWIEARPRGGTRNIRPSKSIEVNPRTRTTPQTPAAVASSIFAGGPMRDAFDMMAMFEKIAETKHQRDMHGMVSMMQLVTGGGAAQARAGLGAAELELILRNQQETTLAAVRSLLDPVKAEIAALREKDEDGSGAIVGEAAGALGSMFKGSGFVPQAARFVTANPVFAEKALPIVAGVAGELISLFKNLTAPKVDPAPRAMAVPRIVAPVVETPVHVAPSNGAPAVEDSGSLSSWSAPAVAVGSASS